MRRYYLGVFVFVLGLGISIACRAEAVQAFPVFTTFPIRGSSAAWIWHACAFECRDTPSVQNSVKPVPINLDAPEAVKLMPQSAGGYSSQEIPNLSPYLAYFQNKLQRTWHPSEGTLAEGSLFTVVFQLNTSGKIGNIKIAHTSGSAATDASLIKALKILAPLKPLPKGCPDLELTVMFDYKASKTNASDH
jgi:TonB family protein